MRSKVKHIYLWHDCLDCRSMFNRECPLEGTNELEKISDRIDRPDDFCCTRFLDNSDAEEEAGCAFCAIGAQ